MKKIINSLLDWIYKKKCYFCGSSKENISMCSKCFDNMEYAPNKTPREINGAKVYCAGEYQKELQKLIRGLKYHNKKELAYFLAKFMYEYMKNLDFATQDFCIVPVPLFKEREKQRKYNHMQLVAEELSKLCGKEVNNEIVKRIKDTKPQYKLNKGQRMENLSNAFLINSDKKPNSTILLIDDICTTGSTFESITKELSKNRIQNVICLAATTPYLEFI